MSRNGDTIQQHLRGFVVTNWLDGSRAKVDRPTLAMVEAEGYAVVPNDRYRALLDVAEAAEDGCGCPLAAPHRRTCRVGVFLARLREVTQ